MTPPGSELQQATIPPLTRHIGCRSPTHDPQTGIRRVPALLQKKEPEDRQAPQPRHIQDARGRRKARTRSPVLQAAEIVASISAATGGTMAKCDVCGNDYERAF